MVLVVISFVLDMCLLFCKKKRDRGFDAWFYGGKGEGR